MNVILTPLALCLMLAFLTACTPAKPRDWVAAESESPRSILVVPVLNNSVDVDAPLYALSTLAEPLAERGYYVFPVNTVKMALEHEGLYEGATIRMLGTAKLCELFGADSVLYVDINKWAAEYLLVSTTVTVSIRYTLEDAQGRQLWSEKVSKSYSPDMTTDTGSITANLIVSAISAGTARAKPKYMNLMHEANQAAFYNGYNPIPKGPYARQK